MAPLGITKKTGPEAADVPPHIKLFNDVRHRLEVDRSVTFEESGRAFVQAHERIEDPETRKFIDAVMVGAVEIFLNQAASSVQAGLLIHFEDVLKASAYIVSWELRTLRSIKHLELLGKILDASATFYQDKKTLIAGKWVSGQVRLAIARELQKDGTFTLLLQMLKGHVPILEWSPADYAPPPGKPMPENARLNARILYLLMLPAFQARLPDIDLVAFGEACMKEISKNFTGENLKRQKAEDIVDVMTVLMQVFTAQSETFHEFSLSLWLRCFETDAFAIKKLGLENLIRVCGEASRNRTSPIRFGADAAISRTPTGGSTTPTASGQASNGSVGNSVPSASWDDTKVCAWLIEKRVLDILFGSGAQTHSALVGRSKNLLEHMALAGTLGHAQIDMIFESSVGQHESSRGAVHSLLAELLLDLSTAQHFAGSESPPILILHRATSLCAKRPEEMYYFARKLMQLENSARNRGILVSRNPELQKALLEFLWALAFCNDLSIDVKEAEQRADQSLSDFNDALRTAVVPLPTTYAYQKPGERMNEDKIFQEFLSRCEAIIHPLEQTSSEETTSVVDDKSQTDSMIWRACSVLKNLIQLHPDVAPQPEQHSWITVDRVRPEWTKQSQMMFVEELDKRLHLSDWLVDKISSTPNTRSDKKVKVRLDFLRFVAERIRSYECFDFEKLKHCWSSLASRQELRLQWFQELVNADLLHPRVMSNEVACRVFSELICASSMGQLGSERGFDCFAAYFEEVNKETFVARADEFSSPSPSVVGIETLWQITIQGTGKVGEKASQMLLAVQHRLESLNPQAGIAFVERIMTALMNADTDDRKNRCIALASSYFASQVILDSHIPPNSSVSDFSMTQEAVVHHDDLLVCSADDIGKVMEKRFRDKAGFSWYPGLIFHYNPQTNEHSVFFRDGEVKKYDTRTIVRENAPQLAESPPATEKPLYRMLSVVSDGQFRLDPKVPAQQIVVDAIRKYRGVRINLAGGTTLAQLKVHVMDHLGRKGLEQQNLTEDRLEFVVESDGPLALVPEYLKLRTNIPAAAGGKIVSYARYRILNETLPASLLASRFGGRLFLCARTVEPAQSPQAKENAVAPERTIPSSDVSPAAHLSRENSPHHQLLMSIIQDATVSEETRKQTWNLLMALPTERGLKNRTGSPTFDWGKELNQCANDSTVLRQIYLLQLADRLSMDAILEYHVQEKNMSQKSPFESSFFKASIADHVLELFTRVMSSEFEDEWEREVALRVIVRLIKRFVEHKLVSNSKQLSRDLTRLILWDMSRQLNCKSNNESASPGSETPKGIACGPLAESMPASTSATPGLEDTGEEGSASFSKSASDLSSAAVLMANELVEDESNRPALLNGSETGAEKTLTDVLLESTHLSIRENTYRLLLKIAETNRETVFACVLRTLERIPAYTVTCANFFDFVNEFIVLGTQDQVLARCASLMKVVRARLHDYTYSGTGEDPTLNGYVDLCRRLVEHGAGSEEEDKELIETLLSRYLLAVSATTVNIASSPQTRQRCFALLKALANKSPSCFLFLLSKLDEFVNGVDRPVARGGRFWDFNFRADDTRRPPGTYVGLVNQGATCYQNSVLQQLFMRKEMRTLVLNAIPSASAGLSTVGDRDEEEDAVRGDEPVHKKKAQSKLSLLTQFQKLFSFLDGSEQRFFNPRMFVNNSSILRLTDGHMSQNDCIEFYSLMMEYLEDVFKGRPERDQLRNLFVCSMTSLTMRHCPQKHRSEKEESTFYISLSIRYGPEGRALNSLEEALDEWSKSEHLSDLICEECFPPKPELAKQSSSSQASAGGGAKVDQPVKQRFDADQIKFITRFPPILVLQLKRFDFDYDTLLPTKLNHRVSFEQRLDLGRFTREAVLRQYEGGGEGEEPHVWYRLKGVVVHQGTGANFGHYYSFIEDDDKKAWFRFDDERVTPFDLANLEEECFGGPIVHSDSTKSNVPAYAAAAAASAGKRQGFGGLRNNNGYLLIYTKEEQSDDAKNTPLNRQFSTTLTDLAKPPSSLSQPLKGPLRLRTAARFVSALIKWKTRARAYIDAKLKIKEHETFVAKENERALRHSIAFAPDFLQFCLRIVGMASAPNSNLQQHALTETGVFAVNAISRIVLFAFSEKERYDQWVNALKDIFRKSEVAERTVSDWLLTKVTKEEGWLERLLVQCLDIRSSALFTELITHSLNKADDQVVKELAESLVRAFPKNALEAARFVPSDGNFFGVLRAVATKPGIQSLLLSKDVVLQLIRLLDESAQVPAGNGEQNTERVQQQHARGSEMGGYTTVVRDEKLCAKVVRTLDAILCGQEELKSEDDEDMPESNGFPLLSAESAKAIQSESFLLILVHHSPRAAKRIIAKLCDCSTTRYERCLGRLLAVLTASQYAAKASEAPYTIPDVCHVMEYLLRLLDLDPNGLPVREHFLTELVKLAKETRRQAVQAKEAQGARSMYYPSAYADDRMDTYRASILLITHVGAMFANLAKKSDACRAVLKRIKYSWLVQAMEVSSFESHTGGNEACAVRQVERGREVRDLHQTAIALGQLPRPSVLPCFTLAYYVEDAGSGEVNGFYRFDGFFPPGASDTVDTVTPRFARVDPATGKRFTIYRCSATESQLWYISELSDKPGTTSDIDYYQSKDTGSGLPSGKWMACGQGQKPAPRQLIPQRSTPNPEDDLLQYFVA